MDGSEIKKNRVCPVCDEAVSADMKVCPSCSTDLSLFSADEQSSDVLDPEELKKSIMSEGNGHMSELLKAAEDDGTLPPKPQPVELVYDDSVECPECGKPIPADAEKCPHCGVQFEVEEVFECPMCGTLLEITVTKCPSCGAEFEDESQPAPAVPPPVEAKKPEPPPPEKKSEPVSFVDRLKQVKEEPGQTPAPQPKPQREMTFAERMKAMKEGKAPEELAPPQTAPQPQPVPPAQPQQQQKLATGTGTSISERVKTLQQGAPAQEAKPQPAAPTPGPTPAHDGNDDQYKDLPRYIGEVKRLLILANELKLDVSTSKNIINKAVTAGKSRDLETAIRLVKEGKEGIERELRAVYLSKSRTLETAMGLEKKSGKDVSQKEIDLADARRSLEAGDFTAASDTLRKIEEQMMASSPSKMSEAELDNIRIAIENSVFLRLNVDEAKSFYEEARKAASMNDAQMAIKFAKQATDCLNKVLPAYIAGEMRKAKVTLREIKMMNVEISSPVQMLKEANDHVLHGDYCTALRHIRSFKEFVQKVEQ